jgi:ribosomal protein L28
MFPSFPSSFAAALSQPFKRAQLGLFHGKTKQYGNSVPFSKKKTRRSWLPNIQSKRLFSDALGQMVRVKLTTRALKTIRKVRRTLSAISSHHLSACCSVADSTTMCSKQGRTCLAGRACVCASRCERRRRERHQRQPRHPPRHTHMVQSSIFSNQPDCTPNALSSPPPSSSFLIDIDRYSVSLAPLSAQHFFLLSVGLTTRVAQ